MKTYDVAKDLKRIRLFFEKSQSAFGEEIGMSKSNVLRIENGLIFPRGISLEGIYSYSYENGLSLNKAKVGFFEEDKGERVLLFHGARGEILGQVDNKHSLPPNDFGKGFYLGESLEQAATWVATSPHSSVYCFYFERKADLTFVDFPIGREWMYAILYYRGAFAGKKVPDEVEEIARKVDSSDYLFAPIADNRMYEILGRFMNKEITDEACLHALSMTDLGRQCVLKSQAAIDSLEPIDRLYLCKEEKKDYLLLRQKEGAEGSSKVKVSLLEYRRKGKYLDELFA